MDRILEKNSEATMNAIHKCLGRLVIADATSTYQKLNDTDFLKTAMVGAAKEGGLNVMNMNIHRFDPHGITAIFVLKESHFSVHTWPELGRFSADIFSCGNEGDPSKAMNKFLELMDAKSEEVKLFERGILRNNERNISQSDCSRQSSSINKE